MFGKYTQLRWFIFKHKVRRSCWGSECYVQFTGRHFVNQDGTYIDILVADFIYHNDWELYKD